MTDFFNWLVNGSISSIIFIAMVSVLAISVVLIFTVSFFQGREISFWPLKIGERPDRKKVDALQKSNAKVSPPKNMPCVEDIFTTEPTAFDAEIQKYNTIYIVGMNLRRTLTNYYGLLESKLTQGANLKFLLVDPKSMAISFIAERNYVYRDKDKLKIVIESTLETLAQLQSCEPRRGTIEVRLLGYIPSYGLILLDPERPNGKIRVDLYPYKVPPETFPSFFVEHKTDKKWFEFFRNQFYTLWDSAKPLDAPIAKDLSHDKH